MEPRYAPGAVPESGADTFSSSGEAGADSMGSSECMLIWAGPSLLWGCLLYTSDAADEL